MPLRINNQKKQTAFFLKRKLSCAGSKEKAKVSSYFFKTGKGEYGSGDKFLGVTVPDQRNIAKLFFDLPLLEIKKMLESAVHEHRFTALIILIEQYKKSDDKKKKNIINFYLENINRVNNWDLVDVSSYKILGDYCFKKRKEKILFKLAKSKNLWRRRIAIVSTFAFIRKGKFDITLKLSEMFLDDDEDLMHKATGWMLREVGKKNKKELENFLNENLHKMPRTMLRYSIEKFSKDERKKYLRN